MIKSINGWRAVFALMIVLFHVGVTGLEEMTWVGVTFFFMASGFLLAMKHPFKQLDKSSYCRFAWRHAAKLYPLQWLALVMWIVGLALIGILIVEPVSFFLNATLLQSWSLTHAIYFSYNKFSWFLSTLLFCYLCYPLLARWFMPLRQRYKALILGAAAVIVAAVLAGSDDYVRTALYVFPPVRIIDFVIGMTLASLLPQIQSTGLFGKEANGTDAELASIALLSGTIILYRACSKELLPWSDAMLWWLAVATILVLSFLYAKREGFIGKILTSRPLQWLGDISFEIFILQGIAALIYNWLVEPVMAHWGVQSVYKMVAIDLFGASAPGLITWLILPIDILLAWAVNRLFTRPVARLLKLK